MIKVLSLGFHKRLGRFHMLTVERCSEKVLFRNLSNHILGTLKFQKYISYDNDLFLQNV